MRRNINLTVEACNEALKKQINEVANAFNDFVSTSKTAMENIVKLMQAEE